MGPVTDTQDILISVDSTTPGLDRGAFRRAIEHVGAAAAIDPGVDDEGGRTAAGPGRALERRREDATCGGTGAEPRGGGS